ncbi:MAG TPA: universal stress protein [Pirellulales bacterium]|nr:universal stress protein [Pirellulales bacterium]
MSKRPDDVLTGRILVALDSSVEAEAAIEAAAALAAESRAELLGLFIENAELLRLAGLPFAAEIGYGTPGVRRLDRESLQRTLQAQAEQARRALAEAANRLRLQWSFQVARGQSAPLALAAAGECDVLMIRFAGRAPRASAGLRRGAARAASRATMVVLDGTPSCDRAVATAVRLAAASDDGLVALVAAPDARTAASMRERVAQLQPQLNIECLHCDAPVRDANDLLKAVRQRQPKALVINRDSPLLSGENLAALTDRLDCPLLLVR